MTNRQCRPSRRTAAPADRLDKWPPPRVFVDANVLYSSPLRDLLMQLAVDDAVTLHWSEAVQCEWATALLRSRPELAKQIDRTQGAMNDSLPAACVTGYEHLIDILTLPDPNDRHSLLNGIAPRLVGPGFPS